MITGSVICMLLLQFNTGYGIYMSPRQVACEVKSYYFEPQKRGPRPDDEFYLVNCSAGIENFRLSDSTWLNNPVQVVRISKDGLKSGMECFR